MQDILSELLRRRILQPPGIIKPNRVGPAVNPLPVGPDIQPDPAPTFQPAPVPPMQARQDPNGLSRLSEFGAQRAMGMLMRKKAPGMSDDDARWAWGR